MRLVRPVFRLFTGAGMPRPWHWANTFIAVSKNTRKQGDNGSPFFICAI
jgi:hypothetical protein